MPKVIETQTLKSLDTWYRQNVGCWVFFLFAKSTQNDADIGATNRQKSMQKKGSESCRANHEKTYDPESRNQKYCKGHRF